jgi:hypothetical protein
MAPPGAWRTLRRQCVDASAGAEGLAGNSMPLSRRRRASNTYQVGGPRAAHRRVQTEWLEKKAHFSQVDTKPQYANYIT